MKISQPTWSLEKIRETLLLNNWIEGRGHRIYRFENDNVMINGKMVGKFKITSTDKIRIEFFSTDFEVNVIDLEHLNLIDHFSDNSMEWTLTSLNAVKKTLVI